MTKTEFKRAQIRATKQCIATNIERGQINALLAKIHASTGFQAAKAAIDRKDDVLNHTFSEVENQGFVFDLQKYRDRFAIGHKVAHVANDDLAIENEPRFAIIQESAKLANSKE